MSRQVDLGQIVPNIQVGTTTTGSPSSQASVINVGTDLNPILNFTIPKGDAGSIKFEIVEQLPTQDIKEDTIYLVPYTKITVQTLPTENIQLHTIYIVESTGKRYVYNSNEWIEISSDNQYIEYVYINNDWEELGSIGVDINLDDYYTKQETNNLLNNKQDNITSSNKLDYSLISNTPDLTDYVKNTDYASSIKGGVVKANAYNAMVNSSGSLYARTRTYTDYQNENDGDFIGKGTLENVITGKSLVSNTDYGNATTGGVVKGTGAYSFTIDNQGRPNANTLTYAQYSSYSDNNFISKGTLENVLTAKIGDIQTLLDNLNTGNGV